MGKRLSTNFYSLDGDYYEVDIYDSSYASTVIDFNCADDGFRLRYDADDTDRMAPIVGSQVRLRMRITTSAHETFIDDLVGSAELRFVLQISKNSNRWWTGVILADQIEIDDMVIDGHPYFFDIVATDGLARLKDIDYNDAGSSYTGKETFRGHIYNCLSKIGLDSFYSSGYYFQAICNWYEDDMTYSTSTDPLDNSRFDHRALITINKKGDIKYKTCYEVLEQIARLWGARLYQAAGSYWLTQINEMDGSTNTVHAYTQAGAYTSRTGVDTAEVVFSDAAPAGAVKVKSGGRFSFLAPVKEVIANYNHYDAQNYAAGEDILSAFTLTDVRSNGNTATLLINFTLDATVDFSVLAEFEPAYIVYRLRIQHGSYYLRRDVNWYDTGFSYGVTYWDNSGGAQYFYMVFGPYDYDEQKITESISIETPVLQTDDDMTFNLVFFQVRALSTSTAIDGANYTVTEKVFNLYVEILQDGTVEDQVNIDVYSATNTNTNNTLRIERDLLVGDGPTENSIAKIQIYTGAAWEDSGDASGGWRVGNSGSFVDITQLLCNEILGGQEAPVRRFSGTKFGPYEMYQNVLRGSERFIFHSGTFTARYDEWDGTWMKVSAPRTAVQAETTVRVWDKADTPTVTAEAPSRQIGAPTRNNSETVTPGTAEITLEGISVTKLSSSFDAGDLVGALTVDAIGTDGVVQTGDVLIIVDPSTGASERATVTSDVGPSDTTINVSSFTATYDMPIGAYIFKDPVQAAAAATPLVEYFDAHSSATITASNTILRIDRLIENGIELSEGAGRDYTFSGADVTLNYTPVASNFKLVYYAS